MDEFGRLAYQELEVRRVTHRRVFWLHLVVWALTGLLLFAIWLIATPDAMPWFIIPILAWCIFLGGHAAWVFMIRSPQEIIMDRERRVMADAGATPGSLQMAATPATAGPDVERKTVSAASGDPLAISEEHTDRKAKP